MTIADIIEWLKKKKENAISVADSCEIKVIKKDDKKEDKEDENTQSESKNTQ